MILTCVSGSDEEVDALKKAYLEHEGDMDIILESVMCATIDDEERFVKILKNLIKKGDLPEFTAFTKESKRKRAERKKRV